jgi:protein-S-isoprenylcysteine O-methyltransferase Ste14
MKKEIKKGYGNASLITGILGLVLFLAPYIAIVLSILALVFSNKQIPLTSNANAGKVLGIIGICINGLLLLLMLAFWGLISASM